MATEKDCIFCKIAKKEIPANVVYENEKVISFLDIRPISKGHTLVIPKGHFVDMLDTPEDVICEVAAAAKKVAAAVARAVGADGFNLGMSNKPAAGQDVMHAHMHIMPRFKGDGLRMWLGKDASREELQRLSEKIVKFL